MHTKVFSDGNVISEHMTCNDCELISSEENPAFRSNPSQNLQYNVLALVSLPAESVSQLHSKHSREECYHAVYLTLREWICETALRMEFRDDDIVSILSSRVQGSRPLPQFHVHLQSLPGPGPGVAPCRRVATWFASHFQFVPSPIPEELN